MTLAKLAFASFVILAAGHDDDQRPAASKAVAAPRAPAAPEDLLQSLRAIQRDLADARNNTAILESTVQELLTRFDVDPDDPARSGRAENPDGAALADAVSQFRVDFRPPAGPDSPRLQQIGRLVFAFWPHGARVGVYDVEDDRARTIDLGGTKARPIRVQPYQFSAGGMGMASTGLGGFNVNDLYALELEGREIRRVAAYSPSAGRWRSFDLPEPFDGKVNVTIGGGVVAYKVGPAIYAFSERAKRWDVLNLPDMPARVDAQQGPGFLAAAGPYKLSLSNGLLVVAGGTSLNVFSGQTGRWQAIDLQARVDAAFAAEARPAGRAD